MVRLHPDSRVKDRMLLRAEEGGILLGIEASPKVGPLRSDFNSSQTASRKIQQAQAQATYGLATAEEAAGTV